MITGEYRTREVIKPDAKPVDNVNKFAWDDDDYITITEWHDFDAEELKAEAQREILELKAKLDESSDLILQFIESMTQANALTWVQTFLENGRALRQTIAERTSIRLQIAELQRYL